MYAIGQYDPDLQMFVQNHGINYDRLLFIRWLIEHDRMNTRRTDDAAEEAPHEHTHGPVHHPN
jgi:hypothetical protein